MFAAYDRGDPVAKEVITQAVEFWGMAVANLVSLFNPEKIIFGGGVFGPATQFLGDIYAEAKKWAQPISIKQVKLQASKLGGDAGLYGAGCLALQAATIRSLVSRITTLTIRRIALRLVSLTCYKLPCVYNVTLFSPPPAWECCCSGSCSCRSVR